MALQQGLQQKQSQNLAMTQQLQQSLKMLQMSTMDLSEIIAQELDNNPLLSVDDGEGFDVGAVVRDDSSSDLTLLAKDRSLEDNSTLDYAANWDDVGKGGNSKFEKMILILRILFRMRKI